MNADVKELLQNPPRGSKTRRALEYGIDLSLVTQNVFGKSPRDRLREMEEDQLDLGKVVKLPGFGRGR